MAEQFSLPLRWRRSADEPDFFVGDCNRIAVQWLERYPDWQHHATILTGPAKSGKSTLAAAFARRHGDAVCVIDDLPQRMDELTLFHQFNRAKDEGCGLLLVAEEAPHLWAVQLPDLASRLAAAPLVRIDQPDDDMLGAVMIKLLRDHGLSLPPEVISYAVPRMERSFKAAVKLADALSHAVTAQGRSLSTRLAAEVIEASVRATAT